MPKIISKNKIIAEVDYKLKNARFFINPVHLASCYPNKQKSTLVHNFYAYISGRIKNFNDHIYFLIEVNEITAETIKELQEKAIDIARAKTKL